MGTKFADRDLEIATRKIATSIMNRSDKVEIMATAAAVSSVACGIVSTFAFAAPLIAIAAGLGLAAGGAEFVSRRIADSVPIDDKSKESATTSAQL